MRKTLAAAATSLAILFTMGTGSAFAGTTLNSVVKSVYGTPYKYGGTTTNGFDCSGFTRYVYSKMGIQLPRVSTAQFNTGVSISKSDLKAGDLVFFNTQGTGKVSHVGVYIGDGKFAHASSSKGIRTDALSNSYYKQRYVGAKRILSQYTYALHAKES
ncbi:NlpC/P60 family protein [Fontibacillus panacisegetis]|uniref:NlpC/P60 family protein n=1 Tax=Fontibacillus panacisegetis TaxID=670482 RepID=A0A1G7UFT5_9BACL|nr:C40 family peptidase [Fontibacillus panacisegetis]SDG46353.1 NlpC/P60 family protein [Fontibacillus panacisegetis]